MSEGQVQVPSCSEQSLDPHMLWMPQLCCEMDTHWPSPAEFPPLDSGLMVPYHMHSSQGRPAWHQHLGDSGLRQG